MWAVFYEVQKRSQTTKFMLLVAPSMFNMSEILAILFWIALSTALCLGFLAWCFLIDFRNLFEINYVIYDKYIMIVMFENDVVLKSCLFLVIKDTFGESGGFLGGQYITYVKWSGIIELAFHEKCYLYNKIRDYTRYAGTWLDPVQIRFRASLSI